MALMDNKPPDMAARADLEQRVIDRGRALRQRQGPDCNFSGEPLEDLLEAWRGLVEYYQAHEDLTIAIVLVRDHRDTGNLLRYARRDESKNAEYRDEMEEALDELDWDLGEIITAVNRRLYPDGSW